MNKKLKIASAAVAVVMAGTMAFGMFGCKNSDGPGYYTGAPKLDDSGKLTYAEGTSLNVNIIESGNEDREIGYVAKQIATKWKGLDGVEVEVGDLKPAWRTLGQKLKVNFNNTAKTGRKSTELSSAINAGEMGDHNFINASAAEIMQNTSSLLDINQYLEYMPNYKAFLEQSPIVQYSLTMNTTNGAMYYIPYFDGNDDIEKYSMVQRQWVRKVLNDTTKIAGTTTFKDQAVAKGLAGTSTSAVAFMGTAATDNWVVETTDPANEANTVWVKCDYGAALEAAKDNTSGLGAAIAAAADKDYATEETSGNIVDLMNYAINAKAGVVTGAQLATILREYIKVAYYVGDTAEAARASTTAMYSANDLADAFNSSSAVWDADLMTAMFRCVVTNYDQFDGMSGIEAKSVWALAGREMRAQRENDLISLAGELYGVRGLESRLEYTYINSKGVLADARTNVKSYEAAAKLHALAEEGLLFNQVASKSALINKIPKSSGNMTFMLHDYVQTQTTDGFDVSNTTSVAKAFDYDFAPIVTAVSRWDTNDDGTAETVMRFTESWRSVKNTGVCIPKASIKSADQLSAILAFIDYLYSNDGQIVGSYGNQASGKTANDGYWYGNPVTATIGGVSVTNGEGNIEQLKTAGVIATNDGEQYYIANTEANKANYSAYFMFDNKIYTGVAYKDRQIPAMTDNNLAFFHGKAVEGSGQMFKTFPEGSTGYKMNHINSYTNYARGIIGSALPIGNKDQGFEYQCTAPCGLDGADVVATALNNGTIQHTTLKTDATKWWYTEAPTVLPLTTGQTSDIKNQVYLDGSEKTVGMFNPTSTPGYSNVYIDIAFWGFDTSLKIGTNNAEQGDYEMQANAAALLSYITGYSDGGLNKRLTYYRSAWAALKAYYASAN